MVMFNKSEYEKKIGYLQDKIKEYEKLLMNNNIEIPSNNEIIEDSYNARIVSKYFTILQKPNGEYYTKITNDKPQSYMKLTSKQFDYLGEQKTPFYTNGMYNQYNHKVIEQYIQYSFYLD